jgi:hypothetical protein
MPYCDTDLHHKTTPNVCLAGQPIWRSKCWLRVGEWGNSYFAGWWLFKIPVAVIPKLHQLFDTFGTPRVVQTDNGPLFNCNEFVKFSQVLGFKHREVAPLCSEPMARLKYLSRL